MARFSSTDLSRVKTISIGSRKSKVRPKDFAGVLPEGPVNLRSFLDTFPNILVAADLRALVKDIRAARRRKKPVILMMGAHVVKVGLAPVIIDLVQRGTITHVAMNSAASIHDVETAMWGHTSEDVAANLKDGTFGMARDTGEFINKALLKGMDDGDEGYGEALAKKLIAVKARNMRYSILAQCYKHDVPVTVHAAIGTDINHQQPTMNGAATGEMSFRDFKVFVSSVSGLTGAGVVLNVGSAVILPEVFLKALTVARNLGKKTKGFTTANFDMIRQYRPAMNVVERPTIGSGRGYSFTGHHEIMVPLLAAMIKHAR
jgi:hypothetical protein